MSAKTKSVTRHSGSAKTKAAKRPVLAKIYPANVEPSKRAKQVIAALADSSVAA
jgi:hypothetical protein